ncbi:hypothetical protein AYX14_07072 [Cryptococcus neoformans]|nr:hypothetical protein AYX14_07072 [Cryptococcus neoformans var. grubii]
MPYRGWYPLLAKKGDMVVDEWGVLFADIVLRPGLLIRFVHLFLDEKLC